VAAAGGECRGGGVAETSPYSGEKKDEREKKLPSYLKRSGVGGRKKKEGDMPARLGDNRVH